MHGSTTCLPGVRSSDGWLCTFIIIQQLAIPSARSWAAPSRTTSKVRKRQTVRPVHNIQITPAGSLSSGRPCGPTCWVSPLAFGLIGTTSYYISPSHIELQNVPVNTPQTISVVRYTVYVLQQKPSSFLCLRCP
jgi:hypothetical protein